MACERSRDGGAGDGVVMMVVDMAVRVMVVQVMAIAGSDDTHGNDG